MMQLAFVTKHLNFVSVISANSIKWYGILVLITLVQRKELHGRDLLLPARKTKGKEMTET